MKSFLKNENVQMDVRRSEKRLQATLKNIKTAFEKGGRQNPSIYAALRIRRTFKARARAASAKSPYKFVKQEFSEVLCVQEIENIQAECAFPVLLFR